MEPWELDETVGPNLENQVIEKLESFEEARMSDRDEIKELLFDQHKELSDKIENLRTVVSVLGGSMFASMLIIAWHFRIGLFG